MSTRFAAPNVSDLSPVQLERLCRQLVDELAAQQARAVELLEPVDLEPDLAGVLLTRCREAIDEIDDALARMRSGTYGSCLACGRAIPYERLEVVPAADRCVACQGGRSRR